MIKRKIPVVITTISLIISVFLTFIYIYTNSIGKLSSTGKSFDKPDGYFNYFKEITTPIGAKSSGYKPNYAYHELTKAKLYTAKKNSFATDFQWISRGPVNVGGRTRCIIVDPDDPLRKTWFAGTASGGIWKTTNAGQSWSDIAPDLPNLSTTALFMAPSDHNTIYAGTGEGYGGEGMVTGNGIFVSIDRGGSWNLLPSTDGNPDFRYVNKLWVDPLDKNILIAATNTGILKSTDGGQNWQVKYKDSNRAQDIIQNPLNSSVLYAGINTTGLIKSVNKGESWFKINSGIGRGLRYMVAISPVDTSYVFACVENTLSEMDVYMSINSGLTWFGQRDLGGTFFNFHQGQGWFNSVIEPHPFNRNEVYIAGVYMGKVSFSNVISNSAPHVLGVDTLGTSAFLGFVNFGGDFLGGGMSTGLDESANVSINDFVSTEIRFGPGKHQKAHRFTVPMGRGSGVVAADYSYQNYVDVPFEVWDIKNNRQLMVSFRDQERDGNFNLIERDADDDIAGREYLFIQAINYDTVPSPLITINGGHYEKMMYFFWPTLASGKTWNPSGIILSKIRIEFGTRQLKNVATSIIHDDTKNTNLHVDHHDLAIIPGANPADPITLIDANDGGVAISTNSGNTWEQLTNAYITTQFYGAAKKPGANEYIGGMQDNGTWQSPLGLEATTSVGFNPRLGGDGFHTIWNNETPAKIMGSSYNNRIYVSSNSGANWLYSSTGINEDGPFITKLSNSRANPNLVFAVGASGVYKHDNFGRYTTSWQIVSMGTGWTYNATAYSSMNVKVSLADKNVVWAGTGMFRNPKLNIFLSKDMGVSFDTVNSYGLVDMGFMSGMATHPLNPAEAFILFSYKGNPKILRTYNYGKSWTDISGFETDSVSSNGFPDVIVHDLLVLPNDTTIMWAGTEIGIIESDDNGQSWHVLNGNLPSVSVYQLFFQDDQFIAATHGRGIWTANLWPIGIEKEKLERNTSLKLYPNPATSYFNFEIMPESSGEAEIKIYSINGQVALNQKIKVISGGKITQRVEISGMKPGTYIFEIKNDNNVHTARFVKR